jgi:HEAT repeat protein/beta-lactamase regulating signal transducer with metallopeptidase domain
MVLEPALWWVGEWTLRWAALIALLAVGLAVWRPRRAATRHLLCLAVLLAGLLLPATPRWGPGLPAPAPEPEEAPAPPALIERPPPLPPAPPAVATAPAVEEEVPRSAPPAAAEPWGARRLTVIGLAALWATGALLLLARWAGGIVWLWRLRRTAVAAPEAAGLFAACRAEMGLNYRVGLASHPAVRSPVALGFLRPLVLVPPVWAELPEAAQRAGLLHELAHLRRQDHRLVPLLELLRAVLFFHLPLHWLLGWLERERELLCDEAAVAHGVAPRQLAHTLLHFASCPGRLLPAPLAFGRRRTIKARIHHLLEDDMERSTSPLPAGRALAAGAVVIGLALGLASLRLWAAAPEAPPPEAPVTAEGPAAAPPAEDEGGAPPRPAQRFPKEALRYAGKSFEQWRTELLTELKPAVRVDGVKALATFGVNGYGTEATRAVLELMRGYDINNSDREDQNVVSAAYDAVRKIGDPAVPALREGLREKNRNVRRFAAMSLAGNAAWAAAAVPDLFAALRDSDPYVRCDAVNGLGGVKPRPKEYLPALLQRLKNEDTRVRNATIFQLGRIGPPAREAVPALLDLLANDTPPLRQSAIQALRAIKPEAKAVLPALIRAVQEPNRGAKPDTTSLAGTENQPGGGVEEEAVQAIGELGPDAADAVPVLIGTLIRYLKVRDESRARLTIAALGRIGPSARAAVPLLRELADRNGWRELQADARKALEMIEK